MAYFVAHVAGTQVSRPAWISSQDGVLEVSEKSGETVVKVLSVILLITTRCYSGKK